MESYTNFAYVYDTFMDQEPYWMWADRFCRLLELYGLPRETDIKAYLKFITICESKSSKILPPEIMIGTAAS